MLAPPSNPRRTRGSGSRASRRVIRTVVGRTARAARTSGSESRDSFSMSDFVRSRRRATRFRTAVWGCSASSLIRHRGNAPRAIHATTSGSGSQERRRRVVAGVAELRATRLRTLLSGSAASPRNRWVGIAGQLAAGSRTVTAGSVAIRSKNLRSVWPLRIA